MKNTLMFLLVTFLLAFSLTACGGNGQTNGAAGDNSVNSLTNPTGNSGSNGSTTGNNGTAGSGTTNGSSTTNGSGMTGTNGAAGNNSTTNGATNDGSLMDGARDAMDDAGRAVRNAADDVMRDF